MNNITPELQHFIEDNMGLLKTKSWLSYFDNWYTYRYKGYPDTSEVETLLYVLKRIGIKFEETEEARRQVIINHVRKEIQDIKKNLEAWSLNNIIPRQYLIECLVTVFLFNESEVVELIEEAVKLEKLTTTTFEGEVAYTWKD